MGRPRKQGRRERNGRPKRRPASETDWQTIEPVLRRRCAELGLRPTLENMRSVRGQEGGTPWGKLWIKDEITRRQHDAARWYAEARARYLRAIAAPKETPSCSSYGDTRGRSLVENVKGDMAARAAFTAVDCLLNGMGRSYKRAIMGLLEEQPVSLVHLKKALDAVAGKVL